MGVAGLVNLPMLVLAARMFFGQDVPGVDALEGVHAALARGARTRRRAPAALAFAVALLASGFGPRAPAPVPVRS